MLILFTLVNILCLYSTYMFSYVDEERERTVYTVYIYIVCTNELYTLYIC